MESNQKENEENKEAVKTLQEKRSHKRWTEGELKDIAFHSEGKDPREATKTLMGILKDRTYFSILNKVYKVQEEEKEKALLAYRSSVNSRPTAVTERVLELVNNTDEEWKEETEKAIEAIEEPVKTDSAPDFPVSERKSNHSQDAPEGFSYKGIIKNGQEYLLFDDSKLIIKGGSLKLGFHDPMTEDFEIEGTFTIKKVPKIELTDIHN